MVFEPMNAWLVGLEVCYLGYEQAQ